MAPEPIPETESPAPTDGGPPEDAQEAKQEPVEDPALKRFESCRWHEKQDSGPSYCSHRDVLPFAGKNGFNATAWCQECDFFKVKRTVRRRSPDAYDDY